MYKAVKLKKQQTNSPISWTALKPNDMQTCLNTVNTRRMTHRKKKWVKCEPLLLSFDFISLHNGKGIKKEKISTLSKVISIFNKVILNLRKVISTFNKVILSFYKVILSINTVILNPLDVIQYCHNYKMLSWFTWYCIANHSK